jgi:hypothetical protein
MKRDIELIRQILLIIEAQPAGERMDGITIPDDRWSDAELIEHIRLMFDADLIEGVGSDTHDGFEILTIRGLTNAGHDLIDSIRSDEVWSQTKEKVGKVGGSVGVETLKTIAATIVTKLLFPDP